MKLKKSEGSISIGEENKIEDGTLDKSVNFTIPSRTEDDKELISEIVRKVNERIPFEFSEEAIQVPLNITNNLMNNTELKHDAISNDKSVFKDMARKEYQQEIVKGYKASDESYKKLLSDQEYNETWFEIIAEELHEYFINNVKNS